MAKLCYGCMQEIGNSRFCPYCGYDQLQKNESHCLPAGVILRGQYQIGRVLGQGGFGITYMGYDLNLEQPLAIKEFFPTGLAGREASRSLHVADYGKGRNNSYDAYRQRFLKEARTLARLRYLPQIVHVLNFFEENNTAYIVMEYIEGMDLRKYQKKLGRPLTAAETLTILDPVMDALSKVHEANLVHRDISPDNMMILKDGSIKLLDFGAARVVENADTDGMLSASTQAIMKPGFAPLEQYQARGALGPWTDVYAMCATIYYCMTSSVPPESMNRLMEGQAINWNKLSGLTSQQISTLQKGMALFPKERIQSISQLKAALQNSQPAPVSTQVTMPSVASRERFPSSVPLKDASPASAEALKWNYRRLSNGLAVPLHVKPVPSDLVLPSAVNGSPVVEISSYAFEKNNNLTSVIIPSSITHIGYKSFGECKNLSKVTIPSTVKFIDGDAFSDTPWLDAQKETFVIVGDGVLLKYNGSSPHVVIPDGVKMISSAFLQNKTIGSVVIPKSVTAIGVGAFLGCSNLKYVNLPEGMTFISASAFFNCSLLSTVTIPESVKEIRYQAFDWCRHLNSVTISRDCKLGERAFPSCCSIHYY